MQAREDEKGTLPRIQARTVQITIMRNQRHQSGVIPILYYSRLTEELRFEWVVTSTYSTTADSKKNLTKDVDLEAKEASMIKDGLDLSSPNVCPHEFDPTIH